MKTRKETKMYLLTIKNPQTQQQKQLSLPLTDLELELKLKEIGVTDINNPINLVNFTNDGYDFPQLPIKMIEHAHIFQINFLAQRINSLSAIEQKNMDAVIEAFGVHRINDLINLTYEVEHNMYRIVEGTEDHDDLGKWFVEKEYYDLPTVILDNIDYNGIGYDLNNYEFSGKFCDKGYVYVENSMDEKIYNGKHLPDFAYERSYIANIKYINDDNGYESYLKLPAGELAMQRVLKELECETFDNCRIDIDSSYIFDQYDYLTEKDDIGKLNDLCNEMASIGEKTLVKMRAIIEYASISSDEMFYRLGAKNDTAFEKLNALYSRLEDFDYFPGIHTPKAYADHLVNNIKFFEIGEELTPYINYEELGCDWIEDEGGKFVSTGYVIDESPTELQRTYPEEIQVQDEEDLEI